MSDSRADDTLNRLADGFARATAALRDLTDEIKRGNADITDAHRRLSEVIGDAIKRADTGRSDDARELRRKIEDAASDLPRDVLKAISDALKEHTDAEQKWFAGELAPIHATVKRLDTQPLPIVAASGGFPVVTDKPEPVFNGEGIRPPRFSYATLKKIPSWVPWILTTGALALAAIERWVASVGP